MTTKTPEQKPDANAKKRRKKITQARCPWCGADHFHAPYIERAWNTYAANDDGGKLLFGESGEDVESHEQQLEKGRCANWACGAPLDLSALEVE